MLSVSWLLVTAVTLFLPVVSSHIAQKRSNDHNSCDHPDCYTSVSDMAASIDWSVDPCDDFFQFTCGRWMRKYDDPNHKGVISEETIIRNKKKDRIQDLLLFKNLAENEEGFQKASDAYKSCVNVNFYAEENLQDIRDIVQELGGWHLGTSNDITSDSLVNLIIKMEKKNDIQVPFSIATDRNEENNTIHYASIKSPQKEKHFLTSMYSDLTAEDIALIATELFGRDRNAAIADAQRLLELESDLKNMMSRKGVYKLLYEFNPSEKHDIMDILNGIFANIKVFTENDLIAVFGESYFYKFFKYIEEPGNAKIVSDYMILGFILSSLKLMGTSLPTPLRDIQAFSYSNPYTSRIDKCLPFVKGCFDYAIAMKYGEVYLDIPKDKEMIAELTEDIRKVFQDRLQSLPWLDEQSRKAAIYKLTNIKGFYVYPDWTSDLEKVNEFYQDIEASPTSIIRSTVSCNNHNRQLKLRSLVVPFESLKWESSPLETNAFYDPTSNHIYILEGYTDSPFFSPHRLSLINYATMGSVIGHELTHGFDNSGIEYDAHGNNFPWLSKESQANFDERAQCLVNQYSNYKLTPKDLPDDPDHFTLNGKLTLGEDIADSGGLILSYYAYKQWLENHQPEILPDILGKNFTNEQAFFLFYSSTNCQKMLRHYGYLLKDEHSPGKFRSIGTLANFEEFGKAFNCPSDSKMVRGENACHIW